MMQPILRPPQMHHRQYLMMQTQYLMFALTIDANSSSAPIFIDQRHMIYPVVAPTITWSGSQLYTKGGTWRELSNILQQLPTTTHWATLSKKLSFHCGGESWDLHIVILKGYPLSSALQKVMTNFEKLALFNSRCHISSEKGERSVGGQSSPDNSRVARFPKEFSQNLATDPRVGH